MEDKWVTRQTLLKRAKNPDDNLAWEEFVRYYQPFIHTILYHMNFRTSEYADIEQEILLTLWKKLPEFELDSNKGHFRSWLSTIIRNKVLELIRKNKLYEKRRDAATEQYMEDDFLSETEFTHIVEQEWQKHIIKTALDNIRKLFSGVAIQAFEMSLVGKTSREIGEALEVSHESVRTLKNRVKQRLMKEIEHLREELEF